MSRRRVSVEPLRPCRLAIVALACVPGCGFILQGTTHRVHVTTSPEAGVVQVDGQTAVAPAHLDVRRKEWTVFRASKDGYHPACKLVGARRNVPLALLDTALVGLPWLVDRPTEALRVLPDHVHVDLEPVAPGVVPDVLPDDGTIRRTRTGRTSVCESKPWRALANNDHDFEDADAPAARPVAEWKGIQIGRTARGELERRLGRGRGRGTAVEWSVDGIPAAVTFDADDRVESIRVRPRVRMREPAIVAAYGKPDRETRSDDFVRIWEYRERGMRVEFAPDDETAAVVEYRSLSGESDGYGRPTLADEPASTAVSRESGRALLYAALGRPAGFNWVGWGQEYAQAQQVYQLVARSTPPLVDGELQTYVNSVMDRLVAVTPPTPVPWIVRIVDVPSLNAMNIGGGYIVLHTGLFKYLDSEAQLAYVMGHEMGHQLRRHVSSIRSKSQAGDLIVAIAAIAVGASTGNWGAAQNVADVGQLAKAPILASFSRDQEREADELGFAILRAAGYRPSEALRVTEKFVELKRLQGASIALFATHPSPEERHTTIGQYVTRLGAAADAGVVTTPAFERIKQRFRY